MENLGVREGVPATLTSLESRDTNIWYRQPNDIVEAYTPEPRSPQGRPHFLKLDTAPLERIKQTATVLTDGKPTQRGRKGESSEGLPGSTKSVGCVERSNRDLGGPGSSWAGEWGVPPPGAGRPTESKSRGAEDARESDPPVGA